MAADAHVSLILRRDEPPLTVVIRRRRGTRQIRVRVGAEGQVSVSCPPSVSLRQARQVLDECREWILEKRGAMLERPVPTLLRKVGERWTVPLLGEDLPLVLAEGGAFRVHLQSDRVMLTFPPGAPPGRAEIEQLLLGWLKRRARAVLEPRLRLWARRMDLPSVRLFCRDQRTLWGSSSLRGVINLNIRLQLLPVEVVDYVIIHELAHQRHMNHSATFWKEVERICPEYREHRAHLRQWSSLLLVGRRSPGSSR